MAADPSSLEVLPWLKTLPVAPEYHPTLVEFQDPIAYILKIEQEASRYGICKIVPPVAAAPKPTVIANLRSSFSARSPSGDPTFTTRQQQIGFCPRRPRPAQKSVWQSGNYYTLSQFEAKARRFEQTHLRKSRRKKPSSSSSPPPLVVESLFWKAAADKPFSVEYANDMPGSGFSSPREEDMGTEAAENVGETAWNMRGVARAKGSLLRFMREEIPGVTSPMVYVAMMFSWFAWHVEDHDLHSLNYLHTGAGKTWYGVPRDATLAFEEVVRVHGYGGEVNPLITFATLAEKTTVMSPEVLIGSGIPCCRLVQNAGEFVVTFPGAYHSGFSHGFNCGEASNIATPGWLKVAKDAAVRRASTNCPPMVSHYQLLYALALSFSLKSPTNMFATPKSLRLKNKLRSLGETLVKETFVQNVIRDNNMQSSLLSDNSSCVVLPQNTPGNPLCPSFHLNYHSKVNPKTQATCLNGCIQAEENSFSVYQRRKCFTRRTSTSESSEFNHLSSEMQNGEEFEICKFQTRGYLDQGLLSCITCGIFSYACVAIIQPREATVEFLMSANCNSFANQVVEVEKSCELENGESKKVLGSDVDYNLGDKEKTRSAVRPFDCNDLLSTSALDLLASAYDGSSESEEDAYQDLFACSNGSKSIHSPTCNLDKQTVCASENNYYYGLPIEEGKVHVTGNSEKGAGDTCSYFSCLENSCKVLPESSYTASCFSPVQRNNNVEYVFEEKSGPLTYNEQENITEALPTSLAIDKEEGPNSLIKPAGELLVPETSTGQGRLYEGNQSYMSLSDVMSRKMEPDSCRNRNKVFTNFCNLDDSIKDSCMEIVQKASVGSSRMHVFCLEHALEVEKRLQPIGGVNIMLVCHPDYTKFVSEAKSLAKELGYHHEWKDVQCRDASKQEQEKIRMALEDEEAIPYNDDWTVKLGINLYHSVNLSKSPFFRKQLPYNEVICKSFAQKSPAQLKNPGRTGGRQKKINFAGKWCGKVWMSNQVHPYLADLNLGDDDDADHSCEPEIDVENGIHEVRPRRNSSNNSSRGKPGKRKMKNTSCTRLDNSNDAGYAEDDDLDADQKSEIDINTENGKVGFFSERDLENNSDSSSRRKKTMGKILAIRSSARKPAYKRLHNSSHADDVEDADQRSEGDSDLENEKKVTLVKLKNGRRKNAHTRLDNSSDAGYSEENSGHPGFADDLEDIDQRSEGDTNTNMVNEKRVFFCRKKKKAARSCTRKAVHHTKLDSSSDAAYAEENFGYDVQDIDQRSEGDAVLENEKRETFSRTLKSKNDSGSRKSGKRRKGGVVRSSSRKTSHTRLDNSSDAINAGEISGFEGYADSVQGINKRFEDGTDQENEEQEILSRGGSRNMKGRSCRKRKKVVRSRNRKPSHTRLDNSSEATCANDDHETSQGSENDTDLENGKQANRPQRNPTNKNAEASKKPIKKRKRSTSARPKKPTRTRLEDDSPAKTDPPSKRSSRRRRLNSGERSLAPANEKKNKRKAKQAPDSAIVNEEEFTCNIDGCSMSFGTRHELVVHKRNVCPERGCGKKFFSHKYLLQHRKVHSDDRPLKCPWKGCNMTFKWAWARTEHIRVHTGERPYECRDTGCGLTFRFVSDFSRHKRKTGHCSATRGVG